MSNKINKVLASTFALGIIAFPVATLSNKQKYESIVEPTSYTVPYEQDLTLSGLHNAKNPSADDIEDYLPYAQHSYTSDINWTFTIPTNIPDIITIDESWLHSQAGSTSYNTVLYYWTYSIKHRDVATTGGAAGEKVLTPTIDGEWITLNEYGTSIHSNYGNSGNNVFWKYSWKYGENKVNFKFTDSVDQYGTLFGTGKAFHVLNWFAFKGEYQYFS